MSLLLLSSYFALSSAIQEEAFLEEFVKRSGVKSLAGVILEATGNTLAYSLSAMQSILDLDNGVDDLNIHFVRKVRFFLGSLTAKPKSNYWLLVLIDVSYMYTLQKPQMITTTRSFTSYPRKPWSIYFVQLCLFCVDLSQ